MNENTTYSIPVEWSDDDAYITLPDEVLSALDAKEGDTLKWDENSDGSYTLTKVSTSLFLVETVTMFRHRYVVEAKSLEHAYDTVALNEAKELSQQYIDESIVSGRMVSHDDYMKLFDTDNDYLRHITEEEKLAFITKVDY